MFNVGNLPRSKGNREHLFRNRKQRLRLQNAIFNVELTIVLFGNTANTDQKQIQIHQTSVQQVETGPRLFNTVSRRAAEGSPQSCYCLLRSTDSFWESRSMVLQRDPLKHPAVQASARLLPTSCRGDRARLAPRTTTRCPTVHKPAVASDFIKSRESN